MRSRSRIGLAGFTILMALAVAVPVSAASSHSTRTRWVDDDGRAGPHGCGGRRPASRHIQTAIDRSDRNDVVIVCPGTYVGYVGVGGSRRGMTVRAYSKGTAVVRPPRSLTDGPLGWVEGVSGVTIQGFVFEFPSAGCRKHVGDLQGLWARNADGVRLIGNRIRTSGSDTQGACGYEDGMRIISSTSFHVANNAVRDFKSDGISVEDGSRGKVDGNTVQFYHRASGSDDDGDQGIRIVDGSRAEVTGNLVRSLSGSATPHLELGIVVEDAANGSDIHHNEVRYVETGIGVIGAAARVRSNDVLGVGVGYGAFVLSGTGAQVLANRVRNFDVGIEADTSGTTLRQNDARGSITQGCLDTTEGSGTAGTGNTWAGNRGAPESSPAEICPAA